MFGIDWTTISFQDFKTEANHLTQSGRSGLIQILRIKQQKLRAQLYWARNSRYFHQLYIHSSAKNSYKSNIHLTNLGHPFLRNTTAILKFFLPDNRNLYAVNIDENTLHARRDVDNLSMRRAACYLVRRDYNEFAEVLSA
jgi:hypothetical protein